MSLEWRKLPFSDAIGDESAGNEKTPQSEYLPNGRYPVVDQGKELIAGYVDDKSRLCHAELPVIVFGDHTRCFKYVDFPFCMGADGVKVLRPKVKADVKYLYHFLRKAELPDGGYDRHFKYLKRINVALAPFAEQRRIAEVLDRAEALRAKRRAALAQLDTLTQSIFLDLFGDPETNRKGLKTTHLGSICRRITDGTHQPPSWAETGLPFLFVSNIISGEINFDTQKFISEETHRSLMQRCPVEQGDVLYSTVGSYGVPVVVRTARKFAFQRHIAHLKPDPHVLDSEFLRAMLASPPIKRQADRIARGVAQKTLNLGDISRFLVFCPPLILQRDFAHAAAAVERVKRTCRQSLMKMDLLVATLQNRAFRGELFPNGRQPHRAGRAMATGADQ